MKNSESGRSRGFGFVTFADPANVDVVLRSGPHVLDSRTVFSSISASNLYVDERWSNFYPYITRLIQNRVTLEVFKGRKIMSTILKYF